MTIELKVPFEIKDQALDFQRFLKKNGCTSHIETSLDIDEEIEYSATIGAIEAFLDSVNQQEETDPQRLYAKPLAIENTKEWIADHRTYINKIYTNCETGVAYPQSEILSIILGIDISSLPKVTDKRSEEDERKIDKIAEESGHIVAMILSLACTGSMSFDLAASSITLTRKIPIEELEFKSLRLPIFSMYGSKELEKANITSNLYTHITPRYTVTTGPEFVLFNADDLISHIKETYDRDDYDDRETFTHISICTMLVKHIMMVISEHPTSTNDLLNNLYETPDNFQISYDLSEETLNGILTDMKKLGMITMKNDIIKPAK